MSLDNIPLINGNRYSFASIELRLLGKRYFGVKSINYSDSLEPGEVRGTDPQLIGRTKGKYSADASIEMYLREFDDFAAQLASQAGAVGLPNATGYMEIPFDVIVSFAEDGAPVITHEIIGARIKKSDHSNAEGSDAISVKNDLHVMVIRKNGVDSVTPIVNAG